MSSIQNCSIPEVPESDQLAHTEHQVSGRKLLEVAPDPVTHKAASPPDQTSCAWQGYTPAEALDLYKFTKYLVPLLPPGQQIGDRDRGAPAPSVEVGRASMVI